jgi:hypothetical protein
LGYNVFELTNPKENIMENVVFTGQPDNTRNGGKKYEFIVEKLLDRMGVAFKQQPVCTKPWAKRGKWDMELEDAIVELKYQYGEGGSAMEKWFAFIGLVNWARRKGYHTKSKSILVIHVDKYHKGKCRGMEAYCDYIKEIKEEAECQSTEDHQFLIFTHDEFLEYISSISPLKHK